MNNWALLEKQTVSPLIIVKLVKEKIQFQIYQKKKRIKKLNFLQQTKSKEILEEIDNGRNRVKKDSRVLENNFYSRFIKQNNLGNKFKNIMEEEGLDKVIIELSDLLPENINKIEVENNFIYLDKSLVKDNLERIENIKKNKY